MEELEGKVALVTGGGRGIGRAVALALAARGVRVVVTGRGEKALGETVGEIAYGGGKARHLAGDVRDPGHLTAAVERAVSVFGGLDIVVAAARACGPAGAGEAERAEAIFATNLMAVHSTFRTALRRMRAPGTLVATAACAGHPDEAAVACRASQAGLVGLVQALAVEIAPKGITCNAVLSSAGSSAEEVEPEQVAELVVLVCSSAMRGVTGQTISVAAPADVAG
jgi:NAD(P)-dependent dehydrogenase (short-subunit alcohol dehydrogenase family)